VLSVRVWYNKIDDRDIVQGEYDEVNSTIVSTFSGDIGPIIVLLLFEYSFNTWHLNRTPNPACLFLEIDL